MLVNRRSHSKEVKKQNEQEVKDSFRQKHRGIVDVAGPDRVEKTGYDAKALIEKTRP